MDNPIQVDLGRIAQDLQIKRTQVESVVHLLDEGNTVPFITRYRKETTGNLNEVVIHEIQLRVQRLRDLAERKETILKAIEAQGKLVPDLAAAIKAADNPKRLEDLYVPFKPKKRTKASDARDRGLEPLAFRVWTRDETLTDLSAAAQELVDPEKGVESVEKVLEGVGHILSEAISEMAAVRDAVRRIVWRTGRIVTAKAEIPEGQGLEYRDYFDYSEPVVQIPPHRVLAINRGDKEGPLKVRLDVPRTELEGAVFAQLPLDGHPHAELFRSAAIDALDRLLLPSMEREIRRDLTESAEKHAVEVFARNLRSLLLQPPIPKQVVLAIDPGFRTGCKIAVLDEGGELLEQGVIYPHPPQQRRSDAKIFLKDLVGKHKVGVVAIGNGTACRETEELIAEIIAEGTQFSQGDAVPPGEDATPTLEPDHSLAQAHSDFDAQTRAGANDDAHATASDLGHAVTDENHGQATADESHSAHGHGDDAQATTCSDSSPADAPVSSFETAPDGAGVGATQGAAEHHTSGPVEPAFELPPLSGGAPDSTSNETDVESSPGSSRPDDDGSTAILADSHQASHQGGSEAAAEPETASENRESAGTHAESSQATAEPETAASHETAADSNHTRNHVPSATKSVADATDSMSSAPAVHSAAGADETTQRAEDSAPTSSAEGEVAAQAGESETAAGPESTAGKAPPEGKGSGGPRRSGRSSGRGRSDSSRSRGPSRGKQGPPPPELPPKPHTADALLAQLAYVVVNEAGASVYSTSQIGREEFPDSDATLRSGISIGRRLQDPLSELVKIEPQNIGVGLYQHDVNPKHLKETLESVISSCVNFVGVDLNTASVSLLRHVSGLNQLTARRIVDYRKEHGPFPGRETLLQVEGIGPASFTQAAGFLKITGGAQPLDRTWIHPESYALVTGLLEKTGFAVDVVCDKARLPEVRSRLAEVDFGTLLAELGAGEFTLRDIIEALGRPERDPREDLPKPIFKKGILKIEDLTAGMELKGTVLNVVDFGAFVDIGLKDSGLVHISQLANRYVKSPHDVVSVGDVVTVWVMGVDQERKRVSLTMVKPGTERQRGGPPGARRGGEGRGPGQGQRGGSGPARPPRPVASALTSPPVGAPSVAVLPEGGVRRPDRERGGPPGQGGFRGGEPRGQGDASAGPGAREGAPPRHGHGSGPPPYRGGQRGPYPGQGPGRPPRNDRGPGPRPQSRPSRPAAPPPPLSKDALAGNVPLRTFGQLKQLWEARVEDAPDATAPPAEPLPQKNSDPPPAASTSPPDHEQTDAAAAPASEAGPHAASNSL
jgi:protein Tex